MTTFIVKSRELNNHRFDAEYHFALKRTRLSSPYPMFRLSSLAYFRTGGTPSTSDASYWGGDIPWVSAKDFTTFRFIDSEDHITQKAIDDSTTFFVNRPALLLVGRSGILQHSLPVMVAHRPTAINQDIKAFFPDKRTSVDYLGAFFDIFGARLLPLLCKSGTTVQSLNTNELLGLIIPVPPLDVQKQIVAELDAAYEAKRKADDEAGKLLASIDGVVLDALGIPPPPPPDTSLAARIFIVPSRELINKRLDAISNQGARSQFIRSVKSSPFVVHALAELVEVERCQTDSLDGRSYVGMENIDGVQGEYLATDEKDDISSGIVFRKGNILVPRLRPYLNKIWLASFGGVASTEFYPFIARGVSAEYLSIFLRTKAVSNVLTLLMTGNTLPRVQIEDVLSLPIPVPPKDVQKYIVAKVAAIRAKARTLLANALSALAAAKNRIESEIVG